MSEYTTSAIRQMDGIAHARQYVGNALGGRPRETGAREIIDNAFDEVSGGHAATVRVTLRADSSIEVTDDGRGLPVDFDDKAKANGIVLTLGQTMSGGKFDNTGVTTGLHGIGAAATNAVSKRFDVTVWRGGKQYRQCFHEGRPGHFVGDGFDPSAKFTRKDGEKLVGTKAPSGVPKHGTSVRFRFDDAIVHDDDFDMNAVLFRARATAILTGARLQIIDEGWPQELNPVLVGDFPPGGPDALLPFVIAHAGLSALDATVSASGDGPFVNAHGTTKFTYSVSARPAAPGSGDGRVFGFVNGVHTAVGGTPVTAVTRGIGAALAARASRLRTLGLQKGEDPPAASDFAAVCVATIAATAPGVRFTGQAKDSVEDRALGNAIAADIERKVGVWAAAPPNADTVTLWAKTALEHAREARSVESARARRRSQAKAKSLGENMSLPDKLLPSRVSGRGSGSELFICEGDSALGTIEAARDASFQAAFPLKGKPVNSFGKPVDKARRNDEFHSIERILGCGVGDRCDPEECRYDRIMLASDADFDGYHINALVLSTLFGFYRPLIEVGMVYITMPPLFVVRRGDEKVYCQTEDDRDAAVRSFKDDGKSGRVEVRRNKGLGEMDEADFWDTVLDPEKRTLIRITVDHLEKVTALQNTLFGGSPEGRRTWIAETVPLLDAATLDIAD